MSTTKTATYTLKGVKSFQGMDGVGLNATLCRDGKAVAFLVDEGCGGSLLFRWNDGNNGKEEALFEAFIAEERAKITVDMKDEYGYSKWDRFDGETWVNVLVDAMENAKRMKRLCKTNTLYQTPDQVGTDKMWKVKGVGPEVRARIVQRHKGQDLKFLNDEYGA